MENLVWVNGEPQSHVSSFDRGLAFGDGVFETMARCAGRWVLLDDHVERMLKGLELLGISLDPFGFQQDWQRFSEVCGPDGIAKILVTRGESTRGYAPPSDAEITMILQWFPGLPTVSSPLSLGICSLKLASPSALAGFKHLNRLEQVLASREVSEKGWDDGLLTDSLGRVVETTSKNVFIYRKGVLTTPPIVDCGVAGTLRNWILNNLPAKELDFEISAVIPQVESVSIDDVLEADEVFVCNSVLGVLPVKQVHDRYYDHWPLTLGVRDWVAQNWGIGAK